MLYYSTNHQANKATLKYAIFNGLAPDMGVYMPAEIKRLPVEFYSNIERMSFQEMAYSIAYSLFGTDIDAMSLKKIVNDTLNFRTPVVRVEPNIYALELFHGATLSFKDVGARFVARMLGHFIAKEENVPLINVLVATSGNTGSAVIDGFRGIRGVHIYVLYPKGEISESQEAQFTTTDDNVTAVAVEGSMEDCQSLVKQSFMDADLNRRMMLTSANSINIARLLPQTFYYLNAYAQMKREERANNLVISIPSSSPGNVTAGLIAKNMGVPIKRFVAAGGSNNAFLQYLKTGECASQPTMETTGNAMDIGDPNSLARLLDIYGSHEAICDDISGAAYSNDEIAETIKSTLDRTGHLLDSNSACAYRALREQLQPGETGIFLATTHPAKSADAIEAIIGEKVEVPTRLKRAAEGEKVRIEIGAKFDEFKKFLTDRAQDM